MITPPRASSNGSIVYADFDDPRFATAEFLIAVASHSSGTRVIGKAQEATTEAAMRFAKLGVAYQVINHRTREAELYTICSQCMSESQATKTVPA